MLSAYGELHGRVTRKSFAEVSAGVTIASPSGFRRSRQVPGPGTNIAIGGNARFVKRISYGREAAKLIRRPRECSETKTLRRFDCGGSSTSANLTCRLERTTGAVRHRRQPRAIQQRRRATTLRMHPRRFPPTRRGDPKRRAERSVFETPAVAASQVFVYSERRRGYERVELDFAVGTE